MTTDTAKAIEELNHGSYTCVLCKGDVVYTSTERGVKPLLGWLDEGVDLKGFSAADKVVGKAAAFLYVLLGVREVYAHIMSEPAIETFSGNGISFQYGTSAPYIINRAGTGKCPMEEAVGGLSEPSDALAAVRRKLAELRAG